MAFKMRRSGMQLRSTTSTKPITTRFSSPLHQQVSQEGGDVVISAEYDGDPVNDIDRSQDPNRPSSGSGGGGSKPCPNIDPDLTWAEFSKLECDSHPCMTCENSRCVNTEYCKKKAAGELDEPGPSETEEARGRVDVDVSTPRTNILTPRERRRNQRMVAGGERRNESLIKGANRRIRRAIRAGREPSQGDLQIVSGAALGNLEGINIAQDSAGTRSIFTGYQTNAFQQNPGGQVDQQNYNDQLQENIERIKSDEKYIGDDGRPDLDAIMADARSMTRENFEGKNVVDGYVRTGQYLDDRTKKILRRRGYDSSSGYGDLGSEKARKLQNKLKRKGDQMSEKRKRRINRRIARKGGTPIKMSVELTRPSYKMKGFGK